MWSSTSATRSGFRFKAAIPDTLPISSSTTGTAVSWQVVMQELLQAGPTVKALGDLNRVVAVLISHIRTEDRRLAQHVQKK